ncbi:MAG TPA: hypothetical protein P5218_16150, partial [Planctomycetota bacterium]|nr:hypothetical protein [Planctomycetota bacterium]
MSLLTALLALSPATVPVPPPASQDVLSIFLDRTDTLLKHPKDQGMRRVVDMLGLRLLELPGEIPDMREIPPGVLPMVYEMLGSAKTLRILDARETSPMIPVSFQLSLQPANPERATEWMNSLEGMMRSAGAPLGVR